MFNLLEKWRAFDVLFNSVKIIYDIADNRMAAVYLLYLFYELHDASYALFLWKNIADEDVACVFVCIFVWEEESLMCRVLRQNARKYDRKYNTKYDTK